MKLKDKVKLWFKTNKQEIKDEVWYFTRACAYMGVGYFIGRKVSDICFAGGLATCHGKGLIKFIDPATGLEAKTIEEATNILTTNLK